MLTGLFTSAMNIWIERNPGRRGANLIFNLHNVFLVCQNALNVFLIIGFFLMPNWYDPLIIFAITCGISMVLNKVPYSVIYTMSGIGMFIAPIFTILTYVFFFCS